ncbi:relaxase/mobilization nuclease domain-containing protein [Streptomyces aidingensis]|uniref:MobA/VirD2-like nuclease domain-containing protein n=1 Tax=Streptomyces aidingensis TaxID=910347 RepID=A0A1I1TVZ8_9ACTN|nr:mobilization protein [Streptomyces aidingensis]SFD61418.1 hypothetical protein SAMN05421773_1214 [Streptomyces aidingensis]
MVPDISTGAHTAGLLRYLYGPGRRDEHIDPHIVAAWDIDGAPDPGRDPEATLAHLAERLDAYVTLRAREGTRSKARRHVWHCPVRTAPGDRHLSDEEWAEVARRIVHATGIAPEGDEKACRWIAVRHAQDHIHLVATTVRLDGRRPRNHGDGRRAQAACRQIEKDFGLRRLRPGDGTAPRTPTSAEQAKAARRGKSVTSRQWLRENAYTVLAASRTEAEFFSTLTALGIAVRTRTGPDSGEVIGYSLAAPGDTNARGEPIWYGGSKLAPDLSIHRIRERLTATGTSTVPVRRAAPMVRAEHTLRTTFTVLHGEDEPAAQAHLAAFGELLHTATLVATGPTRAELAVAASAFNRATRSAIRAEHHKAAALRAAAKDVLSAMGSSRDGAGLELLLSTALLIATAAVHWHRTRRHQQQAAAARQTLHHLKAAYQHTTGPVLAALAGQAPAAEATSHHAPAVHRALPAQADRILTDPAWPALSAALACAQADGHHVQQLLATLAAGRELETAHAPAQVLLWRLTHQPGGRALAAVTRSSLSSASRMTAPSLPSGTVQPASVEPPLGRGR